jgi:hypothetical protein
MTKLRARDDKTALGDDKWPFWSAASIRSVIRALLVAATVVVALVGLARLGGALRSGPEVLSPTDAQATNVRRTVVADAQRIIANPPTATAPLAATPVPRPSCPNAIWWHEARGHLGEVRSVQGAVLAVRAAPNGRALLEVGEAYPDPTGVAVLVPASLANGLGNASVCASGRIENTEGRTTIEVRDRSGLSIMQP